MSQIAYLGRSEAEKGRVSNSLGPFPSASSVDLREDLTPGARLPLETVCKFYTYQYKSGN
jgi:hypothetical protein